VMAQRAEERVGGAARPDRGGGQHSTGARCTRVGGRRRGCGRATPAGSVVSTARSISSVSTSWLRRGGDHERALAHTAGGAA
jgi:hypothetical protein